VGILVTSRRICHRRPVASEHLGPGGSHYLSPSGRYLSPRRASQVAAFIRNR
jgi:hypothetical protein